MTKKMTKKQRNRTVSSKKRRFFRSQVCKGEIFFGEKFDKKHDKKRPIFSPKKQHEIAPKASFTRLRKPCGYTTCTRRKILVIFYKKF